MPSPLNIALTLLVCAIMACVPAAIVCAATAWVFPTFIYPESEFIHTIVAAGIAFAVGWWCSFCGLLQICCPSALYPPEDY